MFAAGAAAFYAKKAAEFTERSSEAASESNKIAKAHASPLIQVHFCKWAADRDPDGTRYIEYVLSNHGVTPAKNVSIWTGLTAYELPIPHAANVVWIDTEDPVLVENIAAGTSPTLRFPVEASLLTAAHEGRIRAGVDAFMVRLTISYFDMWGGKHASDTEWVFTGAEFGGGVFKFVHNLTKRREREGPPEQEQT